jgi:hypothetical protein
MKRTSDQQGSVVCKPRKRGPDVWVFRYMDEGVQKSIPIGTIVKFKTKAVARKEADKLRAEINERLSGLTVSRLCDRFKIECEKGGYLRPHSIEIYKSFAKQVRTELGEWRVDDLIKTSRRRDNGSMSSRPSERLTGLSRTAWLRESSSLARSFPGGPHAQLAKRRSST